MSENAERRAARKRLQAQYRALYDAVVDILFEIDPIGVHVHHNTEKFVPEATSILARLREARFAEDVENIFQQELRRWYGRRRLAPPGSSAPRSRHYRHLLCLEPVSRRLSSLV